MTPITPSPTRKPPFWGWITQKIRNKLLLALLLMTLIPLAGAGYLSYHNSRESLREATFNQLKTVRAIKTGQLSDYFEAVRLQTTGLANNQTVIEALLAFNEGVASLTTEKELSAERKEAAQTRLTAFYDETVFPAYRRVLDEQSSEIEKVRETLDLTAEMLQADYLANNTLPLSQKENFLSAETNSVYDQAHQRYHPYLRDLHRQYQYADLLLVSTNGRVIYSVKKNLDFGTSMRDGFFSKTKIGRVLELASIPERSNLVSFVDYTPYLAAYNQPFGAAATPIFANGRQIGTIILVLSLDQINDFMGERTGLGDTGESYLIGPDNLWRSESRFLDQLGVSSTIANPNTPVNTVAVEQALKGLTGSNFIQDYRGVPVYSVWTPVTIQPAGQGVPAISWVFIAEIDRQEAEASLAAVLRTILIIGFLAVALVTVLAFLLARLFTRQIDEMMRVVRGVEKGDYTQQAKLLVQDELGSMAQAFNMVLGRISSLLATTTQERDQLQNGIMALLNDVSAVAQGDLTVQAQVDASATGAIADSFNYMTEQWREIILQVQDTTSQVSSSALELQRSAEYLAEGSHTQAEQIVNTSAALDEIALSIQQVSESSTLSARIGEKARSTAQEGSLIVQSNIEGMARIRQQVQETAKQIKRLGESSQEIGEIVQLIRGIAKRTSILSLNAAIQASHAGEAGRGFAVVAEEVERLAERANQATIQIAELVTAIQSDTNAAVTAMEVTTQEVVNGSQLANQAGQSLTQIETVANQLAELIQSISLASQQQARGSELVARTMNEIATVTQQTASGTQQASSSLNHLAQLTHQLSAAVSNFQLSKN